MHVESKVSAGALVAFIAACLSAFAVLLFAQPAAAICGDSVIDCQENCDDGNAIAGDGCNQYCRIEYGYDCPTSADGLSLGPSAYWPLDDAGATAADQILANDGTVNGAQMGANPAVQGSTGTATNFDGLDDYIEIAHAPQYFVDEGAVAFWFNAEAFPTGGAWIGLFSKDALGTDSGGHLNIFLDGTRLRYRLQPSNGGLGDGGDPCTVGTECGSGVCNPDNTCASMSRYIDWTGPTLDTWHHVVATFGPAGMELYIDGTSVGTHAYSGGLGASSGGPGNTEPITLGASQNNSSPGSVSPLGGFFDGRMDEVYFFDYQLSATEVTTLYGGDSCASPGGACTAGAPPGCGDGILDSFREQCDDNNLVPGDGCDALCMNERCGDGIVNNTTEECDDGDRRDGDGCDPDCMFEPGYTCTGDPSVCSETWTCKNGTVEPGEVCDPEPNCAADCQRLLTCGDGIVDPGEACDDYNVTSGDGCDASCAEEPGWTCTVTIATPRDYPSDCRPTLCGDNIIAGWDDGTYQWGEQCDDGNTTPGDGCDERCQTEACGDGFVKGAEQCDDANTTSGDGCSSTCTIEAGFVCPQGGKAGRCVPETVCDPGDYYLLAMGQPSSYSSVSGGYLNFECPFNPTSDYDGDAIPDCSGSSIVVYHTVPAFDIVAGETEILMDAREISPTTLTATIEVAQAISNGSNQPSAAGFTTIVTNGSAPTMGDTVRGNFDVSFLADAPYSFPGGGLIFRITPTSGDAKMTRAYDSPRGGGLYIDFDSAYPWFKNEYASIYSFPLVIKRGTAVCGVNKLGKCQTIAPGPRCVPPGRDFPQTASWCGNDGSTASECAASFSRWSWSTGSGGSGDLFCPRQYLYEYRPTCNAGGEFGGNGSCTTSNLGSKEILDLFCINCDDGDPCTSNSRSYYTGCYWPETGNTSCWTGDPSQRNVGQCADGIDYCRNPGTECLNQTYPSEDVCDNVDNDCNATIDDAATADPTCDDSDPSTSDTCGAGGVCQNDVICAGTDTSCGTTGPCTDCTALNGWEPSGTTQPCCDGGQSCLCDEYVYREYICSAGSCTSWEPPVSPSYLLVPDSCSTCDDANVCTNDSCNVATGLCDNVDSGYSASCYEGPAGTEGVGICAGGTEACSGGVLGACSDVEPTTEACNNLDDDCNGTVDDGNADASCIPVNESCWSGLCDTDCTSNAQCAADEYCYFENGVTPGRCAPQTGSCDDVDPNCPAGSTCFEGSCTNTNCGNDLDCNVYSKCYNSGRCLKDETERCKGVQCPNGEACVKGSCKPTCTVNSDCTQPGNRCYDGFCFPDADPCEGVDCQVNEVCWQGSCDPQCNTDADCTDPGDVCYDAFRCAPETDPCQDLVCAVGDICSNGACYPDCSSMACLDVADKCYDASRCATNNCEGVQCPEGEACQGGVCYLVCAADTDCNPPDICWGTFCKPSDCDSVQCAPGEVCSGGACYVNCTDDADCSALDPSHLCYGGLCTDDPCAGVLCPVPGEVCLGGGCYPYCTSHGQCVEPGDVCYDVNVCATDPTDLCSAVNCPSDQFCVSGSCYYNCSSNDDCTVYDIGHACYDGRCASDACDGISCPIGDVCSQGTCYQYCDGATSCADPNHICYNNTCRPEPLDLCADVVCAVGEVCSDGTCYQYCDGSADCSDPSHVCYDNLCQDPCESTSCLAGETCHLGTCYEYCDGTDPCSNPDHICFDNRCVDAEDPWCDGVMCPGGEDCYRGTCYTVCGSDADCSLLPYDSICYQNVCLPTDCTPDPCETGEVCYNGACYEDCSGGTQCSDPSMACYDDRCAASACEAQAVNFLTDYDDNHLFHKLSKRLYAWQYSTPWMWPRPYQESGTGFVSWADVGSTEGSSSGNDAIYSKGAARVVMYYDDTDNTYVLYLIQGSKDAAQGPTEATYGIRVKSTSPQILVMDDPGAEGARIADNGGGTWTYIQLDITTGASETGGVAIGRFNANAAAWRIEINGHFSGDINRWEVMNGETGTPIRSLNMGEPLTIENKEFSVADEIQPDFGVTPCDSGNLGVCGPGSVTACVNWGLECTQTVYPWGFEICDGLDNTCNGQVDTLDPTLQFAMAETRQSSLQPWSPWPTVDSNSDINAYMNFTARTNDTVGSTNVLREDGTPLQQADKVIMAMHRHVPTGDFSMPMLIGAKSEDEDDREDFGDTDFRMEVRATSGDKIEELWVCWYDDREPGYTSDQIPETYDGAADIMDFDWEVEDIQGHLESDSAVLRPVWLQGKTGRTISYAVDFKISDEDDLERRWRRYSPGIGEYGLWRVLDMYVRIVATNPDESYCISDSVSAAGCPIGYYQCTSAGIVCGPPDDAACASSCADWDGDGHIRYDPGFCPDGTDCDDFDPETHRGATEFCNGRDNDCDGNVDYQSEASADQPLCTADAPCGPYDCNGNFVCSCPNDAREEVGDSADICTCGENLSP